LPQDEVVAISGPFLFNSIPLARGVQFLSPMIRTSSIALAALAAVPVILLADASGPDPGYAGVPGELGTCAVCHGSGASSVNTKGGSVSIAFPNGPTYTPGQKQHWVVTVADSTARRWGFEATARQASSNSTQAGSFKSTDTNTQVLCSTTGFRAQFNNSGTCASNAPLMYVEHTLAGTRLGTTGSVTFEFDWTPPATDVGAINVYIAGNAANGNNQDDFGDHIYSASYTLKTATNGPTVTSVVNGASFTGNIAAGSWVSILGTNLSGNSRSWTSADFTNGTPTSLDGVSVSIGGKAAFVYYISPTQINVQAPDVASGSTSIVVTSGGTASNTATATVADYSPAFFVAGNYAIATHADGSLVAPAGTFAGSTPAARGETVTLWGTGFGATTPSVAPGQTAGSSAIAYVNSPPSVSIGGVTASVYGAALNPSALGLYQVTVTVPPSAPSGDQPIVASVGGQSSPASGVLFSVQ
jgi:uncharacterized protein (TIGR03437 family)